MMRKGQFPKTGTGIEAPKKRSVLVVEDEYALAAEIAGGLRERDCDVLGPAPTVEQAFAVLADHSERPDAAILDIRLRSEECFGLADTLMNLGVPFIFATGFGRDTIPARFASIPVIEKPAGTAEVISRALARVPDRRRARRARRNLTSQAAHAITERIVTGQIQPGQRLLEVQLAQDLGLSRIPLREALRQLHARGVLVGGGYAGYRAIALDPERRRQVLELSTLIGAVLIRHALSQAPDKPACWPAMSFALARHRHAVAAGGAHAACRAEMAYFAALRDPVDHPSATTVWDCLAPQLEIIRYQTVYREGGLAAVAADLARFHEQLLSWTPAVPQTMVERALAELLRQVPDGRDLRIVS
jgi:DNA-binding GntR family transcriptional regulator/ActR/RegA family two-component response regulator